MYKRIPLLLTFGCISAMASTAANYDLLGRKGSKMNSPMVYRNVDYSKADKTNMHNVLAKQAETKITKATGALRHVGVDVNGCADFSVMKSYWFNGKEMSQSAYLDKVNQYEASYAPRINYNGHGEAHKKTSYSAGWRVSYGVEFNPNGEDYSEQSRYEPNVTTSYHNMDRFYNWTRSGISFFEDWDREIRGSIRYYPDYKNKIGVYLASDVSYWNTNENIINKCSKNNLVKSYETTSIFLNGIATLRRFSKNANILFYDHQCDDINGANTQFPVRPDLLPVYMGIHTNGLKEMGDGTYNDRAAYLDDYIYENRMIEVVAAGNLAKTPAQNSYVGYTRKTASALNAITVGAVEQSTNKVAAYTGWKNPKYASGEKKSFDKPEIYGYTNFFSREKSTVYAHSSSGSVKVLTPTRGGTETAAAYIGGMVESLLSTEPFYKWHPEVVKALLLTSSDIDVMPRDKKGNINYEGNDFVYTKDDKDLVLGLTDYAKVFVGNTSRYWIANNSSEIMTDKEDGKPYLTFKEEARNGRVRIAISWLSKSSYATSKGRTPQDFDLFVYDGNGKEIAKSTTGDNPFEIVDIPYVYGTITIKIKLDRDNGERILLGYNMFEYGIADYIGCIVGI